MFRLHPQLKKDCHTVGQFPLCTLLLMNDANYPWFILVPMRENITELFQLDAVDQQQLMVESSALGQALMKIFSGDKLNIAALGNVVPQLHIHHVVRYRRDAAWPAPVWGRIAAVAYSEETLLDVSRRVEAELDSSLFSV
ncbi:MAG: HIT domain-containing protein [Gammaproteobacteria bacterium]|nr:HIT domain-containing protein [Gammaproteobacteria bacterium]